MKLQSHDVYVLECLYRKWIPENYGFYNPFQEYSSFLDYDGFLCDGNGSKIDSTGWPLPEFTILGYWWWYFYRIELMPNTSLQPTTSQLMSYIDSTDWELFFK